MAEQWDDAVNDAVADATRDELAAERQEGAVVLVGEFANGGHFLAREGDDAVPTATARHGRAGEAVRAVVLVGI